VALDGGHDVAHLRAAAAGQRRHQRAIADHHEVRRGLRHHQVVLDADHVGTLAAQHPSAQDPHRLDRRGSVERRGSGSPPVDHQRLVVVIAHTQAADIPGLPLGARPEPSLVLDVQPSEHQTLVLRLQDGPALVGVEDQGVTLEQAGDLLVADVAGAVGPTPREALGLDQGRAVVGLDQLGIDEVDVGLLDGDLRGDLVDGPGRRGGAGRARLAGRTHETAPLVPCGTCERTSLVCWRAWSTCLPA